MKKNRSSKIVKAFTDELMLVHSFEYSESIHKVLSAMLGEAYEAGMKNERSLSKMDFQDSKNLVHYLMKKYVGLNELSTYFLLTDRLEMLEVVSENYHDEFTKSYNEILRGSALIPRSEFFYYTKARAEKVFDINS